MTPPRAELERFIDDHVARTAPLERAVNQASWMACTTGDARYEEEGARRTAELRAVFAQREPYQRLRAWQEQGRVGEPDLDRQLTLLVNAFAQHQGDPEEIARRVRLEKSLEARFFTFRGRLDGESVSDNRLREVLGEATDSERVRAAWDASKQVGAVVREDLLRLVSWRNQAARNNGFDNFYRMTLTLDELDEDQLFDTLGRLETLTREPFRRYKAVLDRSLARRFACDLDALRPWHYGDPFFQEAPRAALDVDRFFAEKPLEPIARRFFAALGFAVDGILARSDLYEREGKDQHAFCMHVDRAGDVRILCNLRSNEFWMGTLLHELGHAIYEEHLGRDLPYLLRMPAHTLTTEAAAMLMGRLSKRASWLERYLGVEGAEARQAQERLAHALAGQLLVLTRWCLVMTHFERALYRDPGRDLDTLWWDLVERFQELRRPEGRRAPDWAAKIHLSVAPVYYHNYMLGEMMASQLEGRLLELLRDGPGDVWAHYVVSPEVGAFLRERLFAPGARRHWADALRHATGRGLDPEFFAAGLRVGD